MPQIMLHQDEVSPAYDYRSYVEATFVIVIPHLITSAIGKQETPNALLHCWQNTYRM